MWQAQAACVVRLPILGDSCLQDMAGLSVHRNTGLKSSLTEHILFIFYLATWRFCKKRFLWPERLENNIP